MKIKYFFYFKIIQIYFYYLNQNFFQNYKQKNVNFKRKKSNWYFDKFLKENKKLFHCKIKKNEKNNNRYELLKKDFQISNILKNKYLLINDIKEILNQLVINKDIIKKLKEENDTFLNQVSNIKEFTKHYLKIDVKNFETHKFKDLILKYKQKGLNIIQKLIKKL